MSVRRVSRRIMEQMATRSGLTDFRLRRKRGCLILMYHSIRRIEGRNGYRYAVDPEAFSSHLSFLQERFELVPLGSVVEMLREGVPIPDRTVALTFDDGYRDNLTVAFPLLEERRIPVTIFLATHLVGRDLRSFLDWADVRAMYDSDLVTFGAHTHAHLTLTAMVSPDAEADIRRGKEEIENRLGERISLFSYPGGAFDEGIKEAVRACGFDAAFVDRPMGSHVDPYAVGRINVDRRHQNMKAFAFELSRHEGVKGS